MEDEVIKEIKKIKQDLALKYNYNVREMLKDILKKQKDYTYNVVNFCKKKGKGLIE